MHRTAAIGALVVLGMAPGLVLGLTACAPTPSPDPALVALREQALSLTRSAQLSAGLRADGRMFATTDRALLGDMAEGLVDVTREAALHRPSDEVDAAYRDELIDASLDALDAVQAAAADEPGAELRLDDAEARVEDVGDDE